MRRIAIVLVSFLTSYVLFAQAPQGGGNRPGGNRQMPNGSLYGKLIDSKNSKPIEYASVQILSNRFDSVSKKRKEVTVAGMLTKANGEFRLENIPSFGPLKLRVTVVGFKPFEQAVSFDLKMSGGNNGDMTAMMGALDKDLGNIKIDVEEKTLENVTVTASNPGLRLGIDRKVFNVDKDLVSAGGTAVDVMRNVPSISVDIDGNVTMRNNTPQIFVDGRPTTMTLDQIPADVIESVEIITNPSAKFDASGGTAGILNVVLKKNKKVGYNGGTRINLDSRAKIGLGGDINLRQEKINLFLNVNYNQRKSISNGTTDRSTFIGTPPSNLYQTDRSISEGYFMFFRGGADFLVDNRNTISVTGNIGSGRFKPVTTSNILVDSLYNPVITTLSQRVSNNKSQMQNKGVQLSFKHNFPKSGQELTADVTYNKSSSKSNNFIQTDNYKLPQNTLTGLFKQQQQGSGGFRNLVLQSDYTNPINDKSKFEIGVRASIRNVDSRNDFFIDSSGVNIYTPLLSVNYNSIDKVYAAYSTYTNQFKSFGYQLGLRVESSNYEGNLPDRKQQFNTKFPVSLFPSVFLSNKMKGDQELQLNYTRKINRPNFFQLYPYTDYSDSLNISRGNPDLKPEFTNSVELSYQKTFKKNKDNFLASIYYKNTTNLITRFQVKELNASNGKDVLINTYINANSAYVTGLEMTLKTKMTKWWDLTSNLNLFTSKINIDQPDQPEQDQFASWFAKVNNTFKLPKNFTIQLSGNYQSKTVLPPGGSGGEGGGRGGGGGMFGGGGGGGGMFGQTTTSQGYVRANYWVDGALKYEFLKNKQASISLNVNDIFKTRRSDVHSESAFFTQDVFRRRDAQVLRLNFSWRFGKFDPNLFKRKNMKNQSDGSENMNMGQ